MRLALLILLIALTPLRGMANPLMATRMASTLAMSVSIPAANDGMHAGDHPCEEMAHTPHHAAEPATTTAPHDGCESCSLCQMCTSAALPAELRVALPLFGPPMQVPVQTERFTSAWAALAERPPHFLTPKPVVGL